MGRTHHVLAIALVLLPVTGGACRSASVHQNQRSSELEGRWERAEEISEMRVGGRPIDVPTKGVLDITSVSGSTVRGVYKVYLFLSRADGVPSGVPDAAQTFDVRGTYEYPHVTLTSYDDDGTVSAEFSGTISGDGRTLRLISTEESTPPFVYVKQASIERTNGDS